MSTGATSDHVLQVSDDELDRLLDQLDVEHAMVAEDRRRSARHPLRAQRVGICAASRDQPGITTEGRLSNISEHGVAFLAAQVLTPGRRVCLTLPIGPNNAAVDIEAVIVRCCLLKGTIFEVGAEFDARRLLK